MDDEQVSYEYNKPPNLDEVLEIIEGMCEMVHELQPGVLEENTLEACTEYNGYIVDNLKQFGPWKAFIMTDPKAKVKGTNHQGHTIGFVQVPNNPDTCVALDATISQGEGHQGELVKTWSGSVEHVASKLREEFGGEWDEGHIRLGLEL